MDDLLNRNLHYLGRRSQNLANRLRGITSDTAHEVMAAESGDLTARNYAGDGSYRFLHSRIDPLQEARVWTDNQRIVMSHIVIIGIGFAYHVRELFSKHGNIEEAYLIEADEQLFQLALRVHVFSDIILNPRIHLLIGSPLSAIKTILTASLRKPFSYHIFFPIVSISPDIYNPLIIFIERHLLTLRLKEGDTRKNHQSLAKGVENLLNQMSTT